MSTDTRLGILMAVFALGTLLIGSLLVFDVIDGWTGYVLLPLWLVAVMLPGTWLQARAEGRAFRLVLRRALSGHPERFPGPPD